MGWSDSNTGMPGICAQNMESLFRVLEASINVRKRYQFFLWSQGELQGLLPHDLLVCATGDIAQCSITLDCFSRENLPPGLIEQLGSAANGLMPGLLTLWQDSGFRPVLLSSAHAVDVDDGRIGDALGRLGLVDCAAHGVADYHTGSGAFFAFFRIGAGGIKAHHGNCLEMLIPHMHMALQRIVFSERMPTESNRGGITLSGRENEILKWIRAGKTNQEIGQILDISPFTVKNHVQKILRKLNVTNRTQAVAKLSAMRPTSSGVA